MDSGGRVNTESSMLNYLFSSFYFLKNLSHIGKVLIIKNHHQKSELKLTPRVFLMCKICVEVEADEAENLTSSQLLYLDNVP